MGTARRLSLNVMYVALSLSLSLSLSLYVHRIFYPNRKDGKRGGVSKNILLKNLLLILSWKEFELVGSIYAEYPASVGFSALNLISLILFMSRFHFIACNFYFYFPLSSDLLN